jgi:aspartate/methionine/tyrosine aminotransferase
MALLTLFSANRGLTGEHILQIREEGLSVKTEVNEALYRWPGFDKTRSSGSFFFVFVTDNTVIYVPQRCFGSNQEAKQFKEEIAKRTGKS